jgi:hypothetical protein
VFPSAFRRYACHRAQAPADTPPSAVHPPFSDGRCVRQAAHSGLRLSADHGFRDFRQLRTFYAAGWHRLRQYDKLRYGLGRSELKEM